MSTKTKTAPKGITKKQFEAAVERYEKNAAFCKKAIADSEAKISKEMQRRHAQLGERPKELEEDAAIIRQYCILNREKLFAESKSIAYSSLKLAFRITPPRLVISEEVEETLRQAIKENGWQEIYIITKESLDRKKILADRELPELSEALAEAGALIVQEEGFYIIP